MPASFKLFDSHDAEIQLIHPLRLREVDGLGMPAIQHLSETYAQQDGETYLGTRLRRRIVSLALMIVEEGEAALWDAREALAVLAAQFATGFRLQAMLPNGAVREILLRYDSGLSLPRAWNMNRAAQPLVLQCVAHDPLLYDPVATLWAYSVSGAIGSWGHEPGGLGFPAGFGGSTGAVREVRRYPGTWRAYPRIRLVGPMKAPRLENLSTGDKLEFTAGYIIDAGQEVAIDLRPGHKTVTHSANGNVVNRLTSDSDLGAWHLADGNEAPEGDNELEIAFTDGTAATRIEIRFNAQYIGI